MNDTVPKKSNDNLKKSNDLIDLWSVGTMFSLLLVIGFILITCSLSMFHISCTYIYLHVCIQNTFSGSVSVWFGKSPD